MTAIINFLPSTRLMEHATRQHGVIEARTEQGTFNITTEEGSDYHTIARLDKSPDLGNRITISVAPNKTAEAWELLAPILQEAGVEEFAVSRKSAPPAYINKHAGQIILSDTGAVNDYSGLLQTIETALSRAKITPAVAAEDKAIEGSAYLSYRLAEASVADEFAAIKVKNALKPVAKIPPAPVSNPYKTVPESELPSPAAITPALLMRVMNRFNLKTLLLPQSDGSQERGVRILPGKFSLDELVAIRQAVPALQGLILQNKEAGEEPCLFLPHAKEELMIALAAVINGRARTSVER